MFKIAILGCENSHADGFLKAIRDENLADIQVMGVYSSFPGEAEDLHETFGVPVMENYDDLVGQLDGLIITARHGANHYKYAKPYLNDGIPMFIDKPITVSEEEAREFFKEITTRGIPVCGGSSVKHADYIQELKTLVASGEKGKVVGGYVRMPLDINSEHGGFFFYAQHLVQSVCEIFGYYPKAVRACRSGDQITCVFRYEDYIFEIELPYLFHGAQHHALVAFYRNKKVLRLARREFGYKFALAAADLYKERRAICAFVPTPAHSPRILNNQIRVGFVFSIKIT
jgi:predicted dehydrogenase